MGDGDGCRDSGGMDGRVRTLTLSCGDEVCATLEVVRGRLSYTCVDSLAPALERWAADGLLEWIGEEPHITILADPDFLDAVARTVVRIPYWTAVFHPE